MRRVDPAELELSIYIQLRMLRGPTRTHLQHLGTDATCKFAAGLIIERCLLRCAIFVPDRFYRRYKQGNFGSVTSGGAWFAGRFGETEPWPLAPLESTTPGRCLVCTTNDTDALGAALAREMWQALVPRTPFEKAGEHRSSFLLNAHRAINWFGRRASDGSDE